MDGKIFREVDENQHAAALQQRESLREQHAVEQVDRLGGRVGAIVAVSERACRGLVHDQGHTSLSGKPVEHIGPFLKPKVESQLQCFRQRDQLRPLPFVQQRRQLLIGPGQDLHSFLRCRAGQRLSPLVDQLHHGGTLLVRKFQLISNARMCETREVKGWQDGRRRRRINLGLLSRRRGCRGRNRFGRFGRSFGAGGGV